ncbi:hypothetical protein D3C72_1880100 [compost metagenome]
MLFAQHLGHITGRGRQRRGRTNHQAAGRFFRIGEQLRQRTHIILDEVRHRQILLQPLVDARGVFFQVALYRCAEQPFFIAKLRIQRGRFGTGHLDQIGHRGGFITMQPEQIECAFQRTVAIKLLRSATRFFGADFFIDAHRPSLIPLCSRAC